MVKRVDKNKHIIWAVTVRTVDIYAVSSIFLFLHNIFCYLLYFILLITYPQIIRQRKLSATAPLTLQLYCKYVTHSGPEVSFKTCVAMKFVDDDDD